MKLVNYLRGVTTVYLEGVTAEKAINRLTECGVLIWNVRKTENGTVLSAHAKNTAKVKSVFPDAKTKTAGLPQSMRKVKSRWLLALLIPLLLGLWFVSGQVIWDFQVTGNETVSKYEILRVLQENGVKVGTVGFTVDSEALSNVVLSELPKLSWFAINVNGTKAVVSVRERVPVPEIVDPYALTDVVAEKSGVVLSAVVYDGTGLVNVGDTVNKGDVLVSGITESYTGTREEHALARIYAATAYELSAKMPQRAETKAETGQQVKKYALEILGRRINLYRDQSCGFEDCTLLGCEKTLKIFGADLPVKLIENCHCEVTTQEVLLDKGSCGKVLKDELSMELRKQCSGEILYVSFDSQCRNGVVDVTLNARCRERIG